MKKKSPILAAILSFVFGPLGYLYIGWRYAILALLMALIFVFVLTVTDFPLPSWMKYVSLLVVAHKGYAICSIRNTMIESGDEDVPILGSFPFAAMAMSDLLVGVGMAYGGAIGLYAAATMILHGGVLKGTLMFLIGTPVLVYIASLVFGFIAIAIDALFSKGMENVFRK